MRVPCPAARTIHAIGGKDSFSVMPPYCHNPPNNPSPLRPSSLRRTPESSVARLRGIGIYTLLFRNRCLDRILVYADKTKRYPAQTKPTSPGLKMFLFYATHDGQSRRIADKIWGNLARKGINATLVDLSCGIQSASNWQSSDMIVLISAVRYGMHLPAANGFISEYVKLKNPPPLALVSVNLTARKPNRKTAQENPYLRKWIKRCKLSPAMAVAFAGRLDYPDYGWFDRLMIRLIMKITGGVTDPQARVEYTNWDEVNLFADEIAFFLFKGGADEQRQ